MIKNNNKWSSIFPNDKELNKVELNEELIKLIFTDDNKWYFAKLKPSSGHKIIFRTIVNNLFRMNIIKSISDKSKHSKLNIDDIYHNMLSFGIANLKTYNQAPMQLNNLLGKYLDEDLFIDDE